MPATATDAAGRGQPGRLRAPAIVIGVGLGGFFDGIVLHQVFQAHHMLSNAGNDRLGLAPRSARSEEGQVPQPLHFVVVHVVDRQYVMVDDAPDEVEQAPPREQPTDPTDDAYTSARRGMSQRHA